MPADPDRWIEARFADHQRQLDDAARERRELYQRIDREIADVDRDIGEINRTRAVLLRQVTDKIDGLQDRVAPLRPPLTIPQRAGLVATAAAVASALAALAALVGSAPG